MNKEYEDFGEYRRNTASSSKRTKKEKENVKADMVDNESYIDIILDDTNCRIKYNGIYIDTVKFYKNIHGKLLLFKIVVRRDNILFWTETGKYNITEYDYIDGYKISESEISNRIMVYNESYYPNGTMKSKCHYDSKTEGLTHGIWYNNNGVEVKKFDMEADDNYNDDI